MMKRLLTTGAIVLSAISLTAQTIPNTGFETWVDYTIYEDPSGWGTSNVYTFGGIPETVTKSTTAHSGTYAAKIETVLGDLDLDGTDDTIGGNIAVGSFDLQSGEAIDGVPFTDRPDSLAAWCKYAPQGGDHFMIVVFLYKWNSGNGSRDVIASGVYASADALADYTRIPIHLDYESADTPDTVSILITTNTLGTGTTTPGTALWVDDLSFVTNDVTAAPEHTIVTELQYYPNPANQALTVIAPKNTTLQVYNALGMLVETLKAGASEKLTIHTAGYRNGVYFLKTESGQLERFVVQH
jgi:hypothetical protein